MLRKENWENQYSRGGLPRSVLLNLYKVLFMNVGRVSFHFMGLWSHLFMMRITQIALYNQ